MEMNTTLTKLQVRANQLPAKTGVYVFKNTCQQVIYIGKANNLHSRVRSYFYSKNLPLKSLHLVARVDSIDYIITANEVEAFLLEASLVKEHKPKYNIRLKDDKAYPYIRCSIQDEFPKFNLTRRVFSDGALYFGPYTSSWAVQKTIQFLNRSFKIRDCTDTAMRNRSRPCMTYQMGGCTAPCVQYITPKKYGRDVKKSLEVLRGGDVKVLNRLQREMKRAAKKEHFETAARLRDSITSFQKVLESQNVVSTQMVDKDVVAYHGDTRNTMIEVLHIRHGRLIGHRSHFMPGLEANESYNQWMTSFLNQYYSDNIVPDEIYLPHSLGPALNRLLQQVFFERQQKTCCLKQAVGDESRQLIKMAKRNARDRFELQMKKKSSVELALEQLQSRLKLPRLPQRIECYDISNTQGQQSVASRVVFIEGRAEKSLYRKYKIKTVTGSNDFASMHEVLKRRLRRGDLPDLMVVDGGKGQLSSALQALKELKLEVPVVALAKAKTLSDFQSPEVQATKERVFLPGRHNPVVLSQSSKACHILVALRDEAHRFAVGYHRQRRSKKFLQSALDSVPGLGAKRKQKLLLQFGGVDKIRRLTADQIAAVEGFHLRLAQQILEHLK